MLQPNKKTRLQKLTIALIAVLLCGLLYFLFVSLTGWGIPCPFRLVTGLKCPGCGITTLLVELFHFNFEAAFWANPLTFCLLPFFVALIVYLCVIYVRKGSLQLPNWMTGVVIAVVVLYVIFGVVRNLPIF